MNNIVIVTEQTRVTYKNISGVVLMKIDMTVGRINSPKHAAIQKIDVIADVTGKYCSMYPNTEA